MDRPKNGHGRIMGSKKIRVTDYGRHRSLNGALSPSMVGLLKRVESGTAGDHPMIQRALDEGLLTLY